MAQHIIKLSEKQLAKMKQIQLDKQVLGMREADLLEFILDTAGIETPVDSAKLDGDKLIVTKDEKKEEVISEAVIAE